MVTIYIVEDELMICEGLCNCFDWASMGARIAGSAGDGKEGLNKILSLKPDIVMTDVMMPRMGGIEMVQELRSRGWNGEVIFISAYQDVELLKQAFKVEAIDYIFKPVVNEELLGVCRIAIRKAEDKLQYGTENIQNPNEFDSDRKLLKKIDDVLQHDLRKTDIDFLAEKLGVSRSTLKRSLKNITGGTAADYIVKKRIQAACGYLRNTDIRINEIAAKVGYQDVRYFSRIFKNVMGMLPVEYRDKP